MWLANCALCVMAVMAQSELTGNFLEQLQPLVGPALKMVAKNGLLSLDTDQLRGEIWKQAVVPV